jgi:4-amino-4-deoxy-L-arabinose transferase-like glycosyltransferase
MKVADIPLEGRRASVGARVVGEWSVRALSVVPFLIAGWMLFGRLGGLPLMEPDEGRNAEVAREMMVSGAWLVPTFDGLPYLDKPAFFFRSVAISFSLLGLNEAAARLPSALSCLAMLAMLFAFCRRRYGETTAALAVLVTATAPLFFVFSRIVIMDAMLGCFVCASIFAACLAEETEGRRRRLWYLASAAAAGCATLVKGPVGFLIPALVVTVFNLADRRRGAVRRCFSPLNLLVFLAVVLPWFLSLGAREPGFFYYGLVEESFHRFTTGSFHRTEPFYFYLPVMIAGLFPWSLLLPEAAVLAWKRRARWSSTDRLFVVWAVVVVIFFSLSQSKLPAYVLTAVVALAALTARVLSLAWTDPAGRAARLVLRGALVSALIYGALAAASFVASRRPDLLASAGSSGALPRSLALLALGLAVAGSVALAARLRKNPRLATAGLALFALLLMTAGFDGLRAYAGRRSEKELATRIGPLPASAEIACFRCFPEGLTWYRESPVAVIDAGGSPAEIRSNYMLFLWKRRELRSSVLVDSARLDAWLAERSRPVLVIGHAHVRGSLEALAAPRKLAVTQITPKWWGVLIPAARGGG